MKTEMTQINLLLAWLWILLGFVSGMMLGGARPVLSSTKIFNIHIYLK